jgi:hypothetical protein
MNFEQQRDVIYELLREEIPEIQRRMATPRVLAHVDILLDILLDLNSEEYALEMQDIEMSYDGN